MQYYHRVGTLYCDALQAYASTLEDADSESAYARHVHEVGTIFHLAQVLYFPEDGSGMGVVGEELLHWLNAHEVAPTTEQGQQIAQTIPPHEHPDYWDYVFRCVFRGFYTTAATVLQSYVTSSHVPSLQSIARETIQMHQTLPRSTGHATELIFLAAHRQWHTSVRVFLSNLQRQMDVVEREIGGTNASDVRLELEAQFRCLLELLCGVQERVLEFSEDWKEALCAWGTLVHPALKRDDLPEMVQVITEALPADGTLPHEMICESLVRGELPKCLRLCSTYDEWLATHLGDYCAKAQLLDDAPGGAATLVHPLLLTWADTLLNEERLWRMALSYLSVIDTPVARAKMRDVLFHVPLLEAAASDSAFQQVEDVLSACIEYGMDDEVRVICRRLGHELMERQQYGRAIAYSIRARDARQVRQVADRLLHDYVAQGRDVYMASVDQIPRKLLERESDEEGALATTPFATTSSIFSSATFAPLLFHFKFRDFLELYASPATWHEAAHVLVGLMTSDVTPENFLSVLLVDALPLLHAETLYFSLPETYELLRVTEKVASVAETNASDSAAGYYFYWLEQLLAHKERSDASAAQCRQVAQERMLVVRLSLTQYLSRVLVEGGA